MWAASLKNPSLSCIHVLSGNHSIQAPSMLFIRFISTGEEQDGPVGFDCRNGAAPTSDPLGSGAVCLLGLFREAFTKHLKLVKSITAGVFKMLRRP